MHLEDREAYRRTTFTAFTPSSKLHLRIGKPDSELDALLREHQVNHWAYITAWNPASELLPSQDNQTRQSQLEQELTDSGYPLFPGEGVPDEGGWEPEKSVLVVGISRQEAMRYGIKYGQNAIVCGRIGDAAELVSCISEE